MPIPTVGSPASWPEGITNQDGKPVKLKDFAGKNVLVYFYPMDDTPGCTIEACNFRDHRAKFPNTVIFGASVDDAASHKAFIAKFSLPYDLLVDTKDKALAKTFGRSRTGPPRPAAAACSSAPTARSRRCGRRWTRRRTTWRSRRRSPEPPPTRSFPRPPPAGLLPERVTIGSVSLRSNSATSRDDMERWQSG